MVDEEKIRLLVRQAIEYFSEDFKSRHEAEVNNPEGTINMKIHNVFIQALGAETQYYTALVRSLDSSLGNMLEKLAMDIAELSYDVKKEVDGPLNGEQTMKIAEILEKYKRRDKEPEIEDYQCLRDLNSAASRSKRHDSDYYLIDKSNNHHFLIELKIGGDLDNKKARSEKEAILEQFSILSNTLPRETVIKIFFATAYNRFGESKEWKQERVRQFFAKNELLIGKDFWNFVCKSPQGYDIVLSEYRRNSAIIKEALKSIKKTYLS